MQATMILEQIFSAFFGRDDEHYDVDRFDQLYHELCEYILLVPSEDGALSGRRRQERTTSTTTERTALDRRGSLGLSLRRRRRLRQGRKLLAGHAWCPAMRDKEAVATLPTDTTKQQQQEDEAQHHQFHLLQTAFRALSATRSADKEDCPRGNNSNHHDSPTATSASAVVWRDEDLAHAMTLATLWEQSVVEVLQQMLPLLVKTTNNPNRQKTHTSHENDDDNNNHLRDDEVFEYFCEHNVLGLWVEMVQAKPPNSVHHHTATTNNHRRFYGVVWSPRVKAQIFVLLHSMIHHATDASTLHYLFSNHVLTQSLLCGMLPLSSQWTEQSLEYMLPPFCHLLQQMTLQLSVNPQCWMPLFVVLANANPAGDSTKNGTNKSAASTTTTTSFPLFSATLATLCSTLAQSDSFLHATCLHLLVNLLQIMNDLEDNPSFLPATTTTPSSTLLLVPVTEQVRLAQHMSHLLVQRYHKMASIATGPVVDAIRSTVLATQTKLLQDDLFALNDLLLACRSNTTTTSTWNVRLCEVILHKCIYIWLQDLLPATGRPILVGVGASDNDVIPEREALAQAAVVCLTYFLQHVAYEPLVRMVAVAVWYPRSCALWCGGSDAQKGREETSKKNEEDEDEYQWTQALNTLVARRQNDQGADRVESFMENPYRQEIIKSIEGVYGEWRVCTANILVEKTIDALDLEDLWFLGIVQSPGKDQDVKTAVQALERYFCNFKLKHLPSRTLRMALECSASLAIRIGRVYKQDGYKHDKTNDMVGSQLLPADSLLQSLETVKALFFQNVLSYQEVFVVSDIFVNLVEDVVRAMYKHEKRQSKSQKPVRIFLMSLCDCSAYAEDSEVMVRKLRSLEGSDVENCRFQIRMALHFRATSRIVRRLCQPKMKSSGSESTSNSGLSLHRFDPADDLTQIFASLQPSTEQGTEIDLSGRMIFSCSSSINLAESSVPQEQKTQQEAGAGRLEALSSDKILLPSSRMTLVLDPTHLFVVNTTTTTATESKRGVILCTIPLLQVIAAATDGDTLHVAVRHDNVVGLIQNGNMTLCFPSTGTSLVMQQYLDRSRQVLREELLAKITYLFSVPD